MKTIQIKTILALVLLVAALQPVSALAGSEHDRDGWLIGMGFGFGRGAFEFTEIGEYEFSDGATPQIRFGHALGGHFIIGMEYSGWMIERGNLEDKARSSQQSVMLGLTWYPCNPTRATGGFYVRGAAGLGWSSIALVALNEELEQVSYAREDEDGLGLQGAVGYEWRIGQQVAAGLSLGVTHLSIDGDIYKEATFGSLAWTLNYYWD